MWLGARLLDTTWEGVQLEWIRCLAYSMTVVSHLILPTTGRPLHDRFSASLKGTANTVCFVYATPVLTLFACML